MKWEELTNKHAQEYAAYLNGYKTSLEKYNADRAGVLQETNCTEENIPEHIHNVLNRGLKAWQEQWGMYGTEFKSMRINHQKEVNQYFEKENMTYRLAKEINEKKTKDHDNSGSR